MTYNQQKHDPNEELQQAIEVLHVFVEKNIDSSIPSVHQLDVKDGHLVVEKSGNHLKKIINLTGCFFGSAFSNHARIGQLQKKNKVNHALLKAVSIVSSHYPLIEKLKQGSVDERRFAEGALDVIQRYNAVISKKFVISQLTWKARFAKYIYHHSQLTLDEELKKSTIILPQSASYESDSVFSSKKFRQESTSNSFILYQKFSSIKPSQHEVDAFRMKGITLINKHQIPSSIQETVSSLKDTPIVVESQAHDRDCSLNAIISLQQILTPFPGEVIKLSGSFKRAPQTSLLSTPIPESFRVSSQSTQTAFPHPLQCSGWALSDVLIPNYPLRPDQMPLFNLLAENKREVAYALLPKGHFRSKAKRLIESKKLAFEKDSTGFLELHNRMIKAILFAADASSVDNIRIVDSFFSHVKSQSQPYEFLAEFYQIIDNECLSSLYRRLNDEWLEIGNPRLRGNDEQMKYRYAADLMLDELALRINAVKNMGLATELSDYISFFGDLVGRATQAIILQSMSEKIGFPPPMLNDFEQKVQSCAIGQVMNFLNEVRNDSLNEDVSTRMKNSIEAEIALFLTNSLDSLTSMARALEISNELEVYFNSRFYINTNALKNSSDF